VHGDMTGPVSARMVLADPMIDIAILETARGGLIRSGMGVPEVNVGAVLNVQSDHLGLKGIDTLEQLAEVKRIVRDATLWGWSNAWLDRYSRRLTAAGRD